MSRLNQDADVRAGTASLFEDGRKWEAPVDSTPPAFREAGASCDIPLASLDASIASLDVNVITVISVASRDADINSCFVCLVVEFVFVCRVHSSVLYIFFFLLEVLVRVCVSAYVYNSFVRAVVGVEGREGRVGGGKRDSLNRVV